jgi:UDPglucose 6-dehydrogenase
MLCNVDVSDLSSHTRVKICNDAYSACKDTDAVLILTEWDEFKTLSYDIIFASMNKPAFIFDGRLILDAKKLRKIGFTVEVIGKSA